MFYTLLIGIAEVMTKNIYSSLKTQLLNVSRLTRAICLLIFPQKNIRTRVINVLLLSLISTLLKFSLPFLAVYFFPANMVIIAMSFGLSYIFGQIEPWVRQLMLTPANAQLAEDITSDILKHYFDLPLDRRLSHPVGEIVQHFNLTYNAIHKMLSSLFCVVVPVIFDISVATIFLSLLSGSASLWLLGIFLIYLASAIWGARRQQQTQKDSIEKIFAIYGNLTPTLSNYENIHYFNKVKYELDKHKILSSNMKAAMIKDMLVTGYTQLRQAIIATTSLILMVALLTLTGRQPLDSTYFILELFYLFQVFLPLNTLTQGISDLHTSIFGLTQVMNFLNTEVVIKDRSGSVPLSISEKRANITFDNVSFSYKKDNETIPVLINASFHIPYGKKTAIVGLSGAGKSTILQLLLRFYDVNNGCIKINDQDIRDVKLDSLREAIAVVPQVPILFNDTLLENLRYANSNADMQAISEAISKAGLAEYINELPIGLETRVGEGGQKISGGERQRLAIARAILKNAPIYIYDEATSSLDVENEKKISDTIDKILPHATTIVITHRLNTIINADQIIVLNDGKVEESGSYAALIKNKDNIFYKMMKTYCESVGISPESVRLLKSNTITEN
jgi:ABC-type multidrug transport system fused ATPase/permease subunit